MWLYQNKEITCIEDLPSDTFGFIYKITHLPSNKSYIGKKYLFLNIKKKLTIKELEEQEHKRGRKKLTKNIQKESDWKTYWGSNKELIELSKKEPKENFEKQILILVPNKKLLTYYEVKYQFINEVLEYPDKWFNDNILAKFYTKDFE